MILVHYITELCELEFENFVLSLKNSNYIAYCQGGKAISSIQKFDKPSCSSCRLCTAWILDPATKSNNCFLCKQVVFFQKRSRNMEVPKTYMPPLLKSQSACGRILIKVWFFFSKSEQFYGLGAGLQSNKLNNINYFIKAKIRILYIQLGQFWFLNNIILNIL